MIQLKSSTNYHNNDIFSKFLPHPPLLCSQDSGWGGLHLQYHRQPAWEIPLLSSSYHLLVISNCKNAIYTEWLDSEDNYWERHIFAGDVVVIPANVQHKVHWHEESDFLLLILDPICIDKLDNISIDTKHIELIPRSSSPAPLIYQIALSLKSELEINKLNSQYYAHVHSLALVINLAKKLSQNTQEDFNSANSLSVQKLERVIRYIKDHLMDHLSLKKISAEINISSYHFARLFKHSTGLSVHQYVLHCRIEKAKHLLKETDLKVIDVAQSTNFQTQSHFTNVFRKHVGKTPTNYRKG
jgi:AraC family transcriptional regulator